MKNPAAPPEIEITPAMIEAGLNAARCSARSWGYEADYKRPIEWTISGFGDPGNAVSAIYTAMLKARG